MLFLVYLQAIWDCYAVDFDVDFVDGVSLTRADISFEGLGALIEVRRFVVDGCAFSSCRISLKRSDVLDGQLFSSVSSLRLMTCSFRWKSPYDLNVAVMRSSS